MRFGLPFGRSTQSGRRQSIGYLPGIRKTDINARTVLANLFGVRIDFSKAVQLSVAV